MKTQKLGIQAKEELKTRNRISQSKLSKTPQPGFEPGYPEGNWMT
jgi:hypothetical protein